MQKDAPHLEETDSVLALTKNEFVNTKTKLEVLYAKDQQSSAVNFNDDELELTAKPNPDLSLDETGIPSEASEVDFDITNVPTGVLSDDKTNHQIATELKESLSEAGEIEELEDDQAQLETTADSNQIAYELTEQIKSAGNIEDDSFVQNDLTNNLEHSQEQTTRTQPAPPMSDKHPAGDDSAQIITMLINRPQPTYIKLALNSQLAPKLAKLAVGKSLDIPLAEQLTVEIGVGNLLVARAQAKISGGDNLNLVINELLI